MNDILKFVNKYAGEALSIASALNSILEGLALNNRDAAKVREVINQLQNAAENIKNSKATYHVTINKTDIDNAVKAYFNKNSDVINNTVKAAVDSELNDLEQIVAAQIAAQLPAAVNAAIKVEKK